ncbi:MAG: alkaline phosphatase family protein, partial [Actinomycetes bacterium]
ADSAGERVAAAAEALRSGDRSLVYVYYGDLDLTGHIRGCSSPAWQFELARVDQFAQQLAGVLPDDGLLLVTADHGMVDVPMDGRIDVAETPILDQGVRLITGEPRATYVHVVDGAREDVASAWRETLGRRAWVLTRDQAVAAGWYGDRVADHVLPRIGDLVVAMRDDSAVVDSRRMRPTLLSLVGMHGSLTDDELLVPLLVAGPG